MSVTFWRGAACEGGESVAFWDGTCEKQKLTSQLKVQLDAPFAFGSLHMIPRPYYEAEIDMI